jgi:hypothetical protein
VADYSRVEGLTYLMLTALWDKLNDVTETAISLLINAAGLIDSSRESVVTWRLLATYPESCTR